MPLLVLSRYTELLTVLKVIYYISYDWLILILGLEMYYI